MARALQSRAPQSEERGDGLREKMISVNRVTKVVKGGRILGLCRADRGGRRRRRHRHGQGQGARKSRSRCRRRWKKRAARWSRSASKNGTLHHAVIGEHGAAKVLMQPASEGTGIIAGGPMRAVFEVMGVHERAGQVLRVDQPLQRGARHAQRAARP